MGSATAREIIGGPWVNKTSSLFKCMFSPKINSVPARPSKRLDREMIRISNVGGSHIIAVECPKFAAFGGKQTLMCGLQQAASQRHWNLIEAAFKGSDFVVLGSFQLNFNEKNSSLSVLCRDFLLKRAETTFNSLKNELLLKNFF